ncbi:hypothetical protein ADIS_3760 [Lunatimonas lonarensis]|uniref:Methyltransferase FkbM domain-containing protein n=1 Tax=Lunatimonas lonarensis TaxID=1232681 RepID=R7ZPB7_9BACT|nr:FkbM family methyltransferase [Lunatimonas lonarensis]EON75869.1 hypothetical protein ADIS_3760 [Lunatimonas lonarensis]
MRRLIPYLRYYWTEVMVGGKMDTGKNLDLLATFYYLLWRAKYFPNKEVTVRVWGMKITADKPKTLQQSLLEIFVHEVYRFDSQLEAPVILDAGANIGISALYFVRKYPGAEIVCVEPNPKAVTYLKKNITANNLSNIHINEVALGADTGFGSLVESPNSLLNTTVNVSALPTPIPVVALTSLMEKHSVDLMKLDIEGGEWEVLNHWLDLKSGLPCPREILVELHPQKTANSLAGRDLRHRLESQGYSASVIQHPFGSLLKALLNEPFNALWWAKKGVGCLIHFILAIAAIDQVLRWNPQ